MMTLQSTTKTLICIGSGGVGKTTLAASIAVGLATEGKKVTLYTEQDYWHDTITTLGEARRQRPNDTTLIEDWKQLLNSQELTSVAAEPILPCCKPK